MSAPTLTSGCAYTPQGINADPAGFSNQPRCGSLRKTYGHYPLIPEEGSNTVNRTIEALGVVAVALLLSAAPASAGEDANKGEAVLRSTPYATTTYGSDVVSGEAELESEGQRTVVRTKLEGLTAGSTHIGHIHAGDCTSLTPGRILHNLAPITVDEEGEGSSTTVLDVSLAGLDNCEWWVAFHAGAANSDPQTPAVAVGPVLLETDD